MSHQEHINKIKEDIKFLDERLKLFREKQRQNADISDSEIDDMIRIKDEKDKLSKDLEMLNEKDEVEYFVNTAPILFQYYDIVEKGAIDDAQNVSVNEHSILKFFMSTSSNNPEPCSTCSTCSKSPVRTPTSVSPPDEYVDTNKTSDRASLLEKYLWLTDDNYVKAIENDSKERCIHCDSSNRNILLNEGMIHCNNCDSIEYILIDHDRPSYKDPPKEISYFSYKRINHLNESKYFRFFIVVFTMTYC